MNIFLVEEKPLAFPVESLESDMDWNFAFQFACSELEIEDMFFDQCQD